MRRHLASRLCGFALLCLSAMAAPTQPVLDRSLVEFTQGSDLALALAPDGERLAMDLQGVIWTMPVAGGAALPLTRMTQDARRPDWSPDGQWLAFQAYDDGAWNLWLMRDDGSEARRLTHGPWDDEDPRFTPDGQALLFSSDRDGSRDLWRLPLDADTPERVSFHFDSDEFQPAISPDGDRIAYVSHSAEGWQLRLRDARGAYTTVMRSDRPLAAPSWRPDGSMLTVVREHLGRREQAMVLLWPEGLVRPTTWDEDVFALPVAWLDRNRMLYTADGRIRRRQLGSRRSEVVPFFATVALERGAPRLRAWQPDADGRRPVKGLRSPRLSPDGRQVAFTALGGLWLADRAGNATVLLQEPFVPLDPEWSPDGRRLVFASDRDGPTALWQIATDGGAPQRIASPPGRVHRPAWSPGGGRIAFLAARDAAGRATDVYVLETGGGGYRRVAESLYAPGRPAWLDADRLLLTALRPFAGDGDGDGVNGWLQITVSTGETQWLSEPGQHAADTRGAGGPSVSADGRQALAVRGGRLWLQPLDAGGRPCCTPRLLGDGPAAHPSWSIDGREAVYLEAERLMRVDVASGETHHWPLGLDWRPVSGDARWVLQAGRVFDPAGGRYLDDHDVFIDGQRIEAVVPRGSLEYPPRVVDARNSTVLPGLIDMHAQTGPAAGERLGRAWLAYGVTTVREPATDPYEALERREAWASGQRPGPRLLTGGPALASGRVRDPHTLAVHDGEQLALELDRAQRLDKDVVKASPRLSPAMHLQLVRAAHAQAMPVTGTDAFTGALHGASAVTGIGRPARLWRPHGPRRAPTRGYDDVVQLFARTGMAMTPALSASGGFAYLTDQQPQWTAHPLFAALHADGGHVDTAAEGTGTRLRALQNSVARVQGAGGLVAAGTADAALPAGAALHAELALLAGGAMSNAEALRSATLDAAWALGLGGHLGNVSAGRLADLLIVDGDPLERIEDTLRVRAVVAAGRYLPADLLMRTPAVNGPATDVAAARRDTAAPEARTTAETAIGNDDDARALASE